ncbi:MAG: type II toxin-antitoxin system HicB family antitoxin [Proteobacteria bacterium]|nr:type II toxin-antitoxin system HicB family antitoxin [Pseudomonadota bacterium]
MISFLYERFVKTGEEPELPDCMADGQTHQEALLNAEIIIKEWIETARGLGREISEARGCLMFA